MEDLEDIGMRRRAHAKLRHLRGRRGGNSSGPTRVPLGIRVWFRQTRCGARRPKRVKERHIAGCRPKTGVLRGLRAAAGL